MTHAERFAVNVRVLAMTPSQFTLFDTSIGQCAIVWSIRGITGLQLPNASPARTRATTERRFPTARLTAPPDHLRGTIRDIVSLLRGEPSDLSYVEIDLENVPAFHQRVYAVTRTIQPGSTMTYGQVAVGAGAPNGARAVGQALGRNPVPIVIPCHRVVAAGGKVGGFSAPGGTSTKQRLLAIERAWQTGQTRALFF